MNMTPQASPPEEIVYQFPRGIGICRRFGNRHRRKNSTCSVERSFCGSLSAPQVAGLVDDARHGGMERFLQLLDLLMVAGHAKSAHVDWVGGISNHSVVGGQRIHGSILRSQVTSRTGKVVVVTDLFDPLMASHAVCVVGFCGKHPTTP